MYAASGGGGGGGGQAAAEESEGKKKKKQKKNNGGNENGNGNVNGSGNENGNQGQVAAAAPTIGGAVFANTLSSIPTEKTTEEGTTVEGEKPPSEVKPKTPPSAGWGGGKGSL